MRYIVTGMSGRDGKNIIWNSDTLSISDYWTDFEVRSYLEQGVEIANASINCGLLHKTSINDLILYEPLDNKIQIGGITLTFYRDFCLSVEYNNELYITSLIRSSDTTFHLPLVSKGVLLIYEAFMFKCSFTKVPTTKQLRKAFVLQDKEFISDLYQTYGLNKNNIKEFFEL